jgi:hypothetical protein
MESGQRVVPRRLPPEFIYTPIDKTSIQFFRHIRNGCAHENRFNITSPLTKPASWRDKRIAVTLHKTPVIPDFLADGDAFLLISDVDAEYFR